MRIVKEAVAGTLESSDALVRVAPSDEFRIEVKSSVKAQFGEQIQRIVEEELAKLGVTEGLVSVDDKGALDFVIKARVQGACLRASGDKTLDWTSL